jgi:hypothetical protein
MRRPAPDFPRAGLCSSTAVMRARPPVLAVGDLGTGLIGSLLMLATGHGHHFEQLANKLRENVASLRDKEAELQSIIYRTPFMLLRLSRDLRYRFISHAYAEMIGRRIRTRGPLLARWAIQRTRKNSPRNILNVTSRCLLLSSSWSPPPSACPRNRCRRASAQRSTHPSPRSTRGGGKRRASE